MKSTDEPIVVEHQFDVSMDRLWNAITLREEMIQWFFPQIAEFEAEVGFKTQFVVSLDDRVFTHLWEIIEVIPGEKIVYDWRYLEYPGHGTVAFELFPNNDHSILRLTNKIVSDFPSNVPEFTRQSGVNGWNYFIENSLPAYIQKA